MKQGKALRSNVGIARWYHDEILKMCRDMFDNTKKQLTPLFVKYENTAMDSLSFDVTTTLNKLIKKYQEYFKRHGEKLAKEFLKRQLKYANISVRKAIEPLLKEEAKSENLKYVLKGNLVSEANKDIVKLAIYNNVSLIRSIPEQYFKDIVGMVTRSIEFGGDIKQLKEQLMKIDGVTERRAKLIAYDQTKKVYSDLSVINMKKAGINRVKWVHSGGDKVPRCYHIRKWDGVSEPPNGLNGYVFELNNPPIIQKAEGKRDEIRGYPAELINCTCFLVPVIE
jgi:uncharacterized protein with gpF-like domain